MDSITHLAVGALTPLAFRNAPRVGAVVLFGIVAGEFPDIDAVAGASAQAMLVTHRSFTHSIPALLVFSLLLAVLFRQLLRRLSYKRQTVRVDNGAAVFNNPADWPLREIWLAALLALALHVYLDCMTTFGTQVFWPLSDFRVAIPALFIIDPFFTLPLLAVLVYALINLRRPAKEARLLRLARLALIWTICYPLACLGLHTALEANINADFAAEGTGIERIILTPTPLSPFYWKALAENGQEYRLAQVSAPGVFSGSEPPFGPGHKKPGRAEWASLQEALPIFKSYAKFVSFPVLRKDITMHLKDPEAPPVRMLTFEDLRYTPAGPEDLTHLSGRGDGMFLMQVSLQVGRGTGRHMLTGWRYLPLASDAESVPWNTLEEAVPLP